MKTIYVVVLTVSILFAENAGAAQCENGWVAYKDEIFIQVFPNFLTYEEAKTFCSAQGSEQSKSSLVMVKESEMQDLLLNVTDEIYYNLWLGGRYDEQAEEFLWADGEPLMYTNWKEGSPRNDSDSNSCIHLNPINENPNGKWVDVDCNRRNLVICQRALSWSLQDAITEIMKLRKELETAKQSLRSTEQNLETTQQNLEATQQNLEATEQSLRQDLQVISSLVVPVGSIYIEYYGQSSPVSLWPNLSWEDITSTYAGLFFRTAGGGSEGWGATQGECAPRITQMENLGYFDDNGHLQNPLNIPASGWSEAGWGSRFHSTGTLYFQALRFNTVGCEVRPKNQAIRIWKRRA